MKMYVGNCTQQVQSFQYRVPEQSGVRMQQIEIGSQTQLSGDLNQKQIDSIVEQHARYGMVREDEIDRTKKFSGLVYQIDRPITKVKLGYLIDVNQKALTKIGEENRKNAAVAISSDLEKAAPGATSVELEVVEDEKQGGDITLNETVHVEDHERTGRNPDEQRGGKNSKRSGKK